MDFPRTHGTDTEGSVVEKHYAVIYAPGKRRARFAENCVQLVDSSQTAIEQADIEKTTTRHSSMDLMSLQRASDFII